MGSTNLDIKNLESLLKRYLKAGTRVLHHSVRNLIGPGENYGSIILAVDVTIQEENDESKILHLVAKKLPANQMLRDLFNVQETFRKELGMYLDVIPALAKFQEDYNTKGDDISNLFAKCYGGRISLKSNSDYVDDDAVLLLENLKYSGFEIGDRLIGFDMDHSLRILKDLARFHAVPIAMKVLKPNEFDKIIYPVVKGAKIYFSESIQQTMLDEVIDVLINETEIIPFIKTITEAVTLNLKGIYRCIESKGPFQTITHTDYWVNNTMILKDTNGRPIENKMVDLQLPAYKSATIDLLFFLYLSVTPDILYENLDAFLLFYYKCFIDCLKDFKIDLKPYSWSAFNQELKQAAPYELGHILLMYKPVLTPRGTVQDTSNWEADDMIGLDNLNDDYKDRMIDTVLSFIHRQWIIK